MPLAAIERVAVTTVVDNSVDVLRADEKVARRWSVARARKIADLRAEHGLAHHVEVTRGRETARIAFDYLVPQHCTGAEAFVRLAQRMGKELVVSSTGSTFTFGG